MSASRLLWQRRREHLPDKPHLPSSRVQFRSSDLGGESGSTVSLGEITASLCSMEFDTGNVMSDWRKVAGRGILSASD